MSGETNVYLYFLFEDYDDVLEALEKGEGSWFHYYRTSGGEDSAWDFSIETARK